MKPEKISEDLSWGIFSPYFVVLAFSISNQRKVENLKIIKVNRQFAGESATLPILALDNALRELRLKWISTQIFPGVL